MDEVHNLVIGEAANQRPEKNSVLHAYSCNIWLSNILSTYGDYMEKFEPTSAQVTASLLAGTGESVVRVVSKTISVRFPIHLLAQVDAMAKISSKSRSLMLFHIVESGVEEIRRASDHEVNSKIDDLAQAKVSEFLEDCDTKNLES